MTENTFTSSIYSQLDEGVLLCNQSFDTVWSNNAATQLLNIDSAQLMGQSLQQLLSSINTQVFDNWQTISLRNHKTIKVLLSKHNTQQYIALLKADSTQHIPVLSLSNQTVLFDETLFKTLFDEAAAGIVLFSNQSEIIKANTAFCNLIGYSEAELLGRTLAEIAHPEDIHIDDILRNKLIDRQISYYQIEKRFIHSTGHSVTGLVNVSLVRDSNNAPCIFVQQFIDIGKRKATEQALRLSERKFLSLFNDSPNLYLTLSPNNLIITDSNRMFTHYTGYSKESLAGKSVFDFIPKNEIDDFKQTIYQLQTQGTIVSFEHRLNCIDGQSFYVNLNASIIYNKTDTPVFYVFSWRDITEQKRITAELKHSKELAEQSDKLKSAFLSNMSHEIRTPMNGIIGFTELLTRSNLKPEQVKKYCQIIKDRGNDLIRIIDDILDISKLDAGAIKIKYETAQLTQILLSVYQLMQTKLEKENKLHIPIKITENLVKLRLHFVTDELRLQQVLINLIDNAIKFTSEGEIIIGGELQDNKHLLLYVKDSGIGITDEFKEVIFGRFRQAEMHSARRFGGNGLGLAICKGLIDLMNGQIWVESFPQKGTTFYINLPVEIIDIETMKQTEQTEFGMNMYPDWSSKIVLLVEDDAVSAELMHELLSETNVTLYHVDNGNDAIKKIKSDSSIQLVLMDIRLPDISGLEVTKLAKIHNPKLPIIAQTAFAMEEERRRFLEAGCDDYLSKPIEREQLIEKMTKIFSRI